MESTKNTTAAGFKDLSFKLGFVMSVFFISRIICGLILTYIHENLGEILSINSTYILHLALSGVFLYGIPLIAAASVLKEDNQPPIAALYKRPPRLAKALGNFPAMYGLGQITNLLTLLAVWIIARIQSAFMEQEVLERSFGTMNSLLPPNMMTGVVLFIHMTFAAAIFEELLCRGIILNALKPYGNGFAIIVSGFMFGIMHGNFQQFLYTFVLGIVLAYITIQTGSILAATILHAMFNGVAAVMMLFMSTETVRDWILMGSSESSGDSSMAIMASFGMYFAIFLILLVAGIALAVRRLLQIKNYGTSAALKGAVCEIGTKRKLLLFVTSVPVIIMLLLTVDAFAGGWIAYFIYGALR